MQDDAAADSRAPGRDLFKEEAVRRTVIINEDLLRIPPLEMVFQSFPQLVPQERSLGDLMEILPAVKFKAAGHLLRHGELAPVPSGHIRPGLHTLVEAAVGQPHPLLIAAQAVRTGALQPGKADHQHLAVQCPCEPKGGIAAAVSHDSVLYRENTIIVVPKFMHRIRSNAKSLILLILLAAGTLSVFGATTLSVWYPYRAVERIIPSAIEYRVEDEQQSRQALDALAEGLNGQEYQVQETNLLKITATSDHLPDEYSISGEEVRTPGFECMSLTDYNALLNSQGKESSISELSDTECVLVKYRPDPENSDVGAVYYLDIGDGVTTDVTVVQTTLDNPIGFANSVATLLVSDQLYQTIASGQPEQITVVSINGGTTRTDGTAYTILKDTMPENIYLASAWQRQTEIIQLNSSTYLLIAFATIIFLIATGSILYFQNLSAVTYDRDDYNILQRMGYNRSMIKRCVRRQIQIYFVIPYVMGMLHSIFAIICYKSALMDDVLGQAGEVILPIALAIGIFSIVYFIYYQVTKYSCYKAAIN